MSLQRYNCNFCWPEITQWNSKHFLKYVYFMRVFEFPPTCWPYEDFIFNFGFPQSPGKKYLKSRQRSPFLFSLTIQKAFATFMCISGLVLYYRHPEGTLFPLDLLSFNQEKNKIKNNIFSFHARKLCISTKPKDTHFSANASAKQWLLVFFINF